jgi:signal peptidase I
VYAVLGVAAGVLLALTVPLAIGARPLVVLSGSMEPTLAVGDVVVAKRIRPGDAHVGDVVTFRDPEGTLTTHRVRAVRRRGRQFEFVTQGDANNARERWTMDGDGELSRALYRVPLAGHVLARTSSLGGKLALLWGTLLVLGAWEVRRIWRPREAQA